MMSTLRIYADPATFGALAGTRVFYCRRDGGPPYMWSDNTGLGQWRYTRVHQSEWKPLRLCHSRKSDLPPALQAKLDAHYLS
jgi:hypothetical protein